jgi:hypothetical protein
MLHPGLGDVARKASLDVGGPEHRVPVVSTPVYVLEVTGYLLSSQLPQLSRFPPDMPEYYFELSYDRLLSHPLQFIFTKPYIGPRYVWAPGLFAGG